MVCGHQHYSNNEQEQQWFGEAVQRLDGCWSHPMVSSGATAQSTCTLHPWPARAQQQHSLSCKSLELQNLLREES